LSNVSATAFIGTNTSTVTITAPAAIISGPDNLCVGSNDSYGISGIPCNASVVWSYTSVGNPQGSVSFNPTSGNIDPVNGSSTVVTALTAGNVGLKATVTTSCGTYEYSKAISIQGPPSDFTIGTEIYCQYGRIISPSYFSVSPVTPGSIYEWSYSKNGGPLTGLPYNEPSISYKFGAGSYEIFCVATNICGSSNVADAFFNVPLCGAMPAKKISASPNPASTQITVTSDTAIQKIELLDKMGQISLKQEYKNKPNSVNLYVGNLKNDIYTLRVYNGKEWESVQLIINR
jgi:hypothetical protein